MAYKYTVTEYSFTEPDIINESQYLDLKNKLQNDPNFSLINPEDTITNHFSRLFKFITGALIALPIFLLVIFVIQPDNGFVIIVMLLLGLYILAAFFAILSSLTDLSTYAGYLRKKRCYFSKFELSIKKSHYYQDFVNDFYEN